MIRNAKAASSRGAGMPAVGRFRGDVRFFPPTIRTGAWNRTRALNQASAASRVYSTNVAEIDVRVAVIARWRIMPSRPKSRPQVMHSVRPCNDVVLRREKKPQHEAAA
jgi:hypothetical protein